MIESVGKSYDNTVSQRWGVDASVRAAVTGDAHPLGMLLYSVREEDENGEKLQIQSSQSCGDGSRFEWSSCTCCD